MTTPDPEEARHEARPRELSDEMIKAGRHRDLVGGQWDVVGKHQSDYLISQGLMPHHTFLDVGCGSLRGGIHFVEYLDAGNYYGIDHSLDLMMAGWEHELPVEHRPKLPKENLLANGAFRVGDFGQTFDYALAQSLFTHIGLSQIRLCFCRVAQALKPGGKFYVTFFEEPEGTPIDAAGGQGKLRSFRNPYWNFASDLEWASSFAPLEYEYIGDWNHPANQKIALFTRISPRTRRPRLRRGRATTVDSR
jgi:SAM-dependent methyltransferase